MKKKVVFCLAETEVIADRIVNRLLGSGFRNEDLSILYPNKSKTTVQTDERGAVKEVSTMKKGSLTTEKHSKAPEGGVAGATTGGVLGGSLGLLAGIGALAIPGLGAFVAAGPIMAALSGTAVGGAVGMLLGSLIGWGIPEYEAKKYEEGLKHGNILISVHAESDEEIKRASDMMKKEGGKDISSTREKAGSR